MSALFRLLSLISDRLGVAALASLIQMLMARLRKDRAPAADAEASEPDERR